MPENCPAIFPVRVLADGVLRKDLRERTDDVAGKINDGGAELPSLGCIKLAMISLNSR